MQHNPVGWFEIHVQDMDRARAFYAEVFGGELERVATPEGGPAIDMWAFPMSRQAYGAAGALVRTEGVEPGRNSVLVYFSCEDCAVEATRAAGAGGTLERPKRSIGQYGYIAFVKDTEGNMIGLHSMR